MTALGRLEDVGAVQVAADGRVSLADGRSRPVDDVVDAAAKEEEDRHRFDRSRLEMMRAYAEHARCRRSFLLTYFGEEHAGACGNCDNCDAGQVEPAGSTGPFEVAARVVHAEWGEGIVQRYDRDRMVVLFDAAGYKTMAVELVSERRLLEPA
jgi:ATP-dependent DNA helicase RecQ